MAGSGCAVVIGAGSRVGIGMAMCRRAASAGLPVYVGTRSADGLAEVVADFASRHQVLAPIAIDATTGSEVRRLFDGVARDGHVPEFVLFNAGAFVARPLLELTPADVEHQWRSDCLAGFLVGQEAVRRMLSQGRGTLVFTGASASLRGRPPFAAFAAAKAGLRAVAQAIAREFGPKGIHVAHAVIDGVVGDGDGSLRAASIADAYWRLHEQDRNAWTHELDLRPFSESF